MALFTAELDLGDERSTTVFTAGGTSTTAITLHVDKAQITEKSALTGLLRELIVRIEESDYPPA